MTVSERPRTAEKMGLGARVAQAVTQWSGSTAAALVVQLASSDTTEPAQCAFEISRADREVEDLSEVELQNDAGIAGPSSRSRRRSKDERRFVRTMAQSMQWNSGGRVRSPLATFDGKDYPETS